jgi:hypothetical protein
MSSIILGQTWGRARQDSGGKGKWHLLAEIRRNVSGQTIMGRWSSIAPGAVFAVALCGMALPDPEWDPQPALVPNVWWSWVTPFPTPKTAFCLPCAEAAIRQNASLPV